MNSGFDMYQNSGYVNTRNRKKTLILDIDDSAASDKHLGAGIEFNIPLHEPLIIDKHSEIYLDNFITYNSNITNNIDSAVFVLKINEFNMNSSVASSKQNQNIVGSIIIPNEHGNIDNFHNVVIHKGKKFNYVCDINPQTIHSLSGKITNIGGDPAFHGENPDATFTYTLVNVHSWIWTRAHKSLEPNELITQLSVNGVSKLTGNNTNILVHTQLHADIHFTSDIELTDSDFLGCGPTNPDVGIVFTIGGEELKIKTIGSTITGDNDNDQVQLIKGFGRFTSEFSIISRE